MVPMIKRLTRLNQLFNPRLGKLAGDDLTALAVDQPHDAVGLEGSRSVGQLAKPLDHQIAVLALDLVDRHVTTFRRAFGALVSNLDFAVEMLGENRVDRLGRGAFLGLGLSDEPIDILIGQRFGRTRLFGAWHAVVSGRDGRRASHVCTVWASPIGGAV